jgi:hypothetical protein
MPSRRNRVCDGGVTHTGVPEGGCSAHCAQAGVIAFNTYGNIKAALRPKSLWPKVELWADKPCSGTYVHNKVLIQVLLT